MRCVQPGTAANVDAECSGHRLEAAVHEVDHVRVVPPLSEGGVVPVGVAVVPSSHVPLSRGSATTDGKLPCMDGWTSSDGVATIRPFESADRQAVLDMRGDESDVGSVRARMNLRPWHASSSPVRFWGESTSTPTALGCSPGKSTSATPSLHRIGATATRLRAGAPAERPRTRHDRSRSDAGHRPED